MSKTEGMCTCGHVHSAGTRCRNLVSGTSVTGAPTYCVCDEWHDVTKGAVPPPPPPVA